MLAVSAAQLVAVAALQPARLGKAQGPGKVQAPGTVQGPGTVQVEELALGLRNAGA